MGWSASNNVEIQAQWRNRVSALGRSGQSIADFVSDKAYAASSLHQWIRWFRTTEAKAGLVAVRISDRRPASPVNNNAMVVSLRCGRTLQIRPGFDRSSVIALVTMLEGR